MSNFKNRNIPKEILALMPPADQVPPSHAPVEGAAEHYRGYLVDNKGNALDPFACRDRRNARRTNPRRGLIKIDDPWGS